MFRIISVLIGYFVGCFQTSYIISKGTKNIDIRQYGSGNAGTTNVIRVLGWKAGVLTFIGDFLKAFLVVLIVKYFFPSNDEINSLYAGLGCVLGHNWPVFMGFKGGKGIASTIGLMLAFDWRIGLILICVLALTILITKYVSLGSILMSIAIPISLAFLFSNNKNYIELLVLGTILMGSALYRHRSNIQRLLKGNESKIGQRSKKKVGE